MDLSQAEHLVLTRFKERGDRAGGIQPGYGMRAHAIRYLAPQAAAEIDQALQGMVEKGWLKPNAAGTWYFLSAEGAEQVKAASNWR
jgi:hypothetical protein